MANVKPRVKVPSKAVAGEVVQIKTLVNHPMETGQRKDKEGNLIPRQIINTFTAYFNGEEVFRADIEPAVSSNPYFEFNVKVPESGTFRFEWKDDDGSTYEVEEEITVS